MLSEKQKNYIRVYMDLTEDTMYFHSASASYPIGKVLLEFIYADLAEVFDAQEKLRKIHPYFSLWTEDRIENFLNGAEEGKVSGKESLEKQQEIYKKLLATCVDGISEGKEEAFHYLQRHPFYSSGTLTNRTVGAENHWMMDYFLTNFEDCLMCEFTEMIRRRQNVKLCKNCGRFFIPKRSNVDYCSRVFSEDGRSCADVGYMKTFAKTVQKDELLQAYTRAYKAHYARMTKPRKRAANMTREDFESWYRQAKEGLELARMGKLDPEEYKVWLKR